MTSPKKKLPPPLSIVIEGGNVDDSVVHQPAVEHAASVHYRPSFRVLSVIFGAIFFIAAILKAHQLFTQPMAHVVAYLPGWVLFTLLQLELILGIWLLTGRFLVNARKVTVICFLLFAIVNAGQGLLGRATCGCLGAVSVNPWIMFAFDVCAAVLAWWSYAPIALRTDPAFKIPRSVAIGSAVAGVAVLIIGIGFHWISIASSDLEEKIHIFPEVHDFGEVAQRQKLQTTFRLVNERENSIQVIRVHSSCNCTQPKGLLGRIIKPAAEAEFSVGLNVGDSGKHGGTVTVFYRDKERKIIAWKSLQVSATIVNDYFLKPEIVEFGTISGNQVFSRNVQFRPDRLPSAKINSIESNHPAVTTAIRRTPSNRGQVVVVMIDPKRLHRSAAITALLRVRTNSTLRPIGFLTVHADWQAPYDLFPQAVVIGSDVKGTVEREVYLRSRYPIKVEKIITAHKDVEMVRVRSKSDSAHSILFRIRAPTVTKAISTICNIQIRENASEKSSELQKLSIPIHRFSS